MRTPAIILLLYILIISALLPLAAPGVLAQPDHTPAPIGTVTVDDGTGIKVLDDYLADSGDAVLYKDYGDVSPNIAIYKSKTEPDRYYAVINQTPVTRPDKARIESRWERVNGVWAAIGNTFTASVLDNGQTYIELPWGNFAGHVPPGASATYTPAVYLNGIIQKPLSSPVLLSADYFGNPNYTNNCIVIDYGICTRLLRLIEGQLQGRWVFDKVPPGTVTIRYNQFGNVPLILSQYGADADTEIITPADVERELRLNGYAAIDDTLTVYPDADPETSTVDGYIAWDYDANSTWDTVHDADGTAHASVSSAGATMIAQIMKWTTGWQSIFRSILLFDTSSLTSTATIEDATLYLYLASKDPSSDMTMTMHVVSHDPTSNTNIVTGDFLYTKFGTTSYGSIIYNNFETGTYNAIAFNASGLNAISKTGITKLGLRFEDDMNDSEPVGVGNYDALRFTMYTSDQGAGFKPTLIITYTATSAPGVTTSCPSPITGTSATFNGDITGLGGDDVTRRGFLYSDSGTPTFADDDIYETSAAFSTGTYSLAATGLTEKTVYYVRAYAVSASGTGYGSVTPFATDLLPHPSDASDHPYYTRVTVYNDSAGTVTDRIQAVLNAGSLVDSYYCQADGSDLVATQSSSGIPLTATEMDGSSATWLLPRETLTAGEELIDLIWMGTESGTRNQLWIADADDTVYTADDATLDAVNTVSITAYVSPSGTPSDEAPLASKPGNYKLALTGSLNYEFTVYQGHGATVSAGTKTVSANGDTTGLEGVTGADSHWQAVSTANDSTYVWDSRPTTGHYDLFTITPAIPDGAVITDVTVWYRAKIAGDCAGTPAARVMPIIYSQATGVISGSPVYTTGGIFATGSHTFATYPLSSDLQIGIDLHSDSNCGESTQCSRLWANVDYTPPGSSETVSISATLDTTEAIRASYNGSTLAIENLSNCDTDTLAASGTLCVSADPLYVAMFDGNIDEVQGTVDGSDAFSYSFEPDEISATTIDDLSGQANDLTYSLSDMNGNITVTVAGITTYALTYYGGELVSSGSPSQIPVYIPDEPGNLTGDEHGYDRFPGAGFVNDMLADAEIPRSAFWLSFFFAVIIGLGFVAFRSTRDILSIILACISILVIQSVTRMGIGYLDIVMLLVCFAALYFRREYSRGQLS